MITSDIAVARNADGRLEIFARGTDGAVWHQWQTAPNNGWSGWASRGGVITSNIDVGRNADGRLELFARGTDNAMWRYSEERDANDEPVWESLGGTFTSDPSVTTWRYLPGREVSTQPRGREAMN